MSTWELAAEVLADAGVTHVFGLPADEPGLLDAADTHPGMTAVVVRDQRVGACAAAGFTAAAGVPSVLALTSGPAFPNALTGLLEAASLNLPLVVVTTRVPNAELGRGAFQELDQETMARPLVKWYARVERADRLAWALRRAVHLAVNGKPGITMIEVTEEAHAGELPDLVAAGPVRRLRTTAAEDDLARAAALLAAAERPLVLAGGGARAGHAGPALTRLAEVLDAPIFTTSSGRGVVDEHLPVACGAAGLYLTPPLDEVVSTADVVCVVGSRLEETLRMGWPELDDRRVVHIDVDPAAFGQAVPAEVELLGDAALTVPALTEHLVTAAGPDRSGWRKLVAERRAEALRQSDASPVADVLRALAGTFGDEVNLVQENGLHDIWGFHFAALRVSDSTTVVGPGEQTMMGFGLPAAIGVALARPERPTVLVCGDGALGISMTAVPTIAELGLGIVVVAFDNRGFGWPRRGRRARDADDHLTRFTVPAPVEAAVREVGGVTFRLGAGEDAGPALARARAAAGAGRLALVVVEVTDDDVPVGVRRIEGLS